MKTVFILSLFLAANALATTPEQIASWTIPGECKGKPANQQCAKYAFLLNLTLAERGIESKALAYHMSTDLSQTTHAVVLFKLGNQWYCIDNENDTPVKVSGKTELAMVKKFDPNAVKIQASAHYKDSGRYLLELANVRAN